MPRGAARTCAGGWKRLLTRQIAAEAHVTAPGEEESIPPRQARVAYIEQIRDKIASVPGVSTVAVAADATPPYAGAYAAGSFEIDGTRDREQPQARVILVDQRYFATLRIALLQGRIWDADENTRGDFCTSAWNRHSYFLHLLVCPDMRPSAYER